MENISGQSGSLIAAAQNILSICSNDFPGPPENGESRVYSSTMWLKWTAFGKKKINPKKIKYEVCCRSDDPNGGATRDFKWVKEVLDKITMGERLPRVAIATPADYIERLLKVEPKHTNRPCWEYADYSGIICVLGAWLAALTWHPDSAVSDFMDVEKIRLVPVTNLDDSAALANNCFFVSQLVCSRPASGAYWALVAAASRAGATVATDRSILSGTDTPRFFVRRGHVLWRDILDALAVLAEVYDRASAGEHFAYAFFKGLHSVSSVVGHSDEGGLVRDVLRECAFEVPFGGLPPSCALHAGLPTLARGAPYSSLVAIVDSLLLSSAAAVAHCAPLTMCDDGTSRPVLITGTLTQQAIDGAGPPPVANAPKAVKDAYDALVAKVAKAKAIHVDTIRPAVLDSFAEFSETYIPGLAKLLGFAPTGEREQECRTWLIQAAASVLETADNRHLTKDSAIAPFYWIEPTTIFSRNFFGTPAEREGWASYGAGYDVLHERWAEGLESVDIPTAVWHYYAVHFQGARKCLWISALSGHKDDGLAQMHFKRLDPEALMMFGPAVAKTGPIAAFNGRVCLADYLWRRGQCSLPHPVELLHLNERVVMAVRHFDPEKENWLAAVPGPQEIRDAMIQATFSAPAGLRMAKACTETGRERAWRTRGQTALHHMVALLRGNVELTRSEGGYIMQVVGPTARRPTADAAPRTTPLPGGAPVSQNELHNMGFSVGATETTARVPASSSSKSHTGPIAAVLHAGTHAGPRLPNTGAAAGGSLATSSPATAAPATGAGGGGVGGAQSNPDGQGAAAQAPAPGC